MRARDVLLLGPAPIEGAGILAREAADRLTGLDRGDLDKALVALDDAGIRGRTGAPRGRTGTSAMTTVPKAASQPGSTRSRKPRASATGWTSPCCGLARAVDSAMRWTPTRATLASGALLRAFPPDRTSCWAIPCLPFQTSGGQIAALECGEGEEQSDQRDPEENEGVDAVEPIRDRLVGRVVVEGGQEPDRLERAH